MLYDQGILTEWYGNLFFHEKPIQICCFDEGENFHFDHNVFCIPQETDWHARSRNGDYASFPDDFDLSPLNPLRTPLPPLKRAGTPCTRERRVTTRTNRPAGRVRGLGLRGSGLKRLVRNQVTLRSLILVSSSSSLRDLRKRGLRLGLCPKPQQGTSSPAPLLRFAPV